MEPAVVLIICDTLRQDVLDVYGGNARTPFLRKFLRDSVIYRNAIAPSSWTFPSHVSLFTGLYPKEHGVHEERNSRLMSLQRKNGSLKAERLAEYMKSRGYYTIGLSNNRMVSSFNYFGIGFDAFLSFDPLPSTKARQEVLEAARIGYSPRDILFRLLKQRKFSEIFKYMVAYYRSERLKRDLDFPLDKGARNMNDLLKSMYFDEKTFLFLNLMEMHDPYNKFSLKEQWQDFTGIKKISDRKVNYFKKQYALEAEYLDGRLEAIVSTLKNKFDYENSMIIITSDHGQAFKEHGYFLHGDYTYDELVRVPLIIKYPKSRKFGAKKGYQSLVNIKKLISDIIEGGTDESLTTETAFSETFGLMMGLPKEFSFRRHYVNSLHNKLRKSVFKDGFKLTLNGTDGTVEEFLKGEKPVEKKDFKDEYKDLLNELKIFNAGDRFVFSD